MDRHFIINVTKEILLATKSVPTAFFVDRKGVSPLNMDTLWREEAASIEGCFMLGRETARERHWRISHINEIAFTTIEKQRGREELVIAFYVPTLPPTFSEQRIEIRRSPGGNITLLDSGEMTEAPHGLLYSFALGIAGSVIPAEVLALLLEAMDQWQAKEAK